MPNRPAAILAWVGSELTQLLEPGVAPATATITYDLGPAWTQLAASGQSVFLQMWEFGQMALAYGVTAPAASAMGHIIDPFETFVEGTLPAHLWGRALGGNTRAAVTVGGSAGASGSLLTNTYSLSGAWQQVASAGQFVHLDHIAGPPINWVYATSVPASLDVGHRLWVGDEFVDAAAGLAIWARAAAADLNRVVATLVVTQG